MQPTGYAIGILMAIAMCFGGKRGFAKAVQKALLPGLAWGKREEDQAYRLLETCFTLMNAWIEFMTQPITTDLLQCPLGIVKLF